MDGDRNLNRATAQIERAQADKRLRPSIAGFFDEATNTVSYVVHDPKTGEAVRIPSRSVPVFKPSRELRIRVGKGK